MEYRNLGKSGLKVPVLSFGAGTFGGSITAMGIGSRRISSRSTSMT